MRRYILAALVALFSFTSCIIDDGYTPDEKNSNRALDYEVCNFIEAKTMSHVQPFICADALLRGDELMLSVVLHNYLSGYTAVVEGNNVKIQHNQSAATDYYLVCTDGKPLSEGGVWTLHGYYGLYNSKRSTCTGVAGEQCAFTIRDEVNTQWDNYVFNSTIRYSMTELNELQIALCGNGRRDYASYYYSYNIDEQTPLIYKDDDIYSPISGALTAAYHDLDSGRDVKISAKITNGTVTYN
jgi:hypothetical protein